MKYCEMNTFKIDDIHVYRDAKQGGRDYMEDIVYFDSYTPETDVSPHERRRNFKFFAVYDGHGGTEAAQFAEQNLKDEIVRQPGFWSQNDDDVVQAIKNGFVSTHRLMKKDIGNYVEGLYGLVLRSRRNDHTDY